VRGDFEFELQAFCMCMMKEILVVLVPFLAFSFDYSLNKVHNMVALMLDPCFKSFDVEGTCKMGQSH
jgi:hypothetical protein